MIRQQRIEARMRIVRTARYARDIKKLKASLSDVEEMELAIATNANAGAVIQGLKGVRKIRFRIANRGKSSGGRAIYYIMVQADTVAMLMAYAKAEKDDLSPDDRKSILRVLEDIER